MTGKKPYTKDFKYNPTLLIYVAGPYTTREGVSRGGHFIMDNIHKARSVAHELMKLGMAVICPHMNSMFMECDVVPPTEVLNRDIEIISRCDAIVLVEDWETSHGVAEEIKFARERGIPVFECVECLINNNPMEKIRMNGDEFLKELEKW